MRKKNLIAKMLHSGISFFIKGFMFAFEMVFVKTDFVKRNSLFGL